MFSDALDLPLEQIIKDEKIATIDFGSYPICCTSTKRANYI